MSSTILIKRSSTSGAVPQTSDLQQGELAVNLNDRKLFTKDNNDAVVELGGVEFNLGSANTTDGADISLTSNADNYSNDIVSFIGTNIGIIGHANGAVEFDASDSNVSTADGLSSPVTISLTGDVSGSATFQDGGDTATILTYLGAGVVDLGVHTSGTYVTAIAGRSDQMSFSATDTTSGARSYSVEFVADTTIPLDLTVNRNATIGGDLSITGNLDVNGTMTYLDSTTVSIGDSLLALANTNTSDIVDIGWYGLYVDSSNNDKFAGIFRDASDGEFYALTELTNVPGSTVDRTSGELATLNAVIDGGTY